MNFALFYIFVTALFPRNNNYGTWKKNLKKQRYPKCIFSMHFLKHVKNFDTFLWNLGLYPKCPWHALNVTSLNFQPSNYAGKLAYILQYPKTKLFMRQIRILISRFFYVPISPTFCGQYTYVIYRFLVLDNFVNKTWRNCHSLPAGQYKW